MTPRKAAKFIAALLALVCACLAVESAAAAILVGPVTNPANGHDYYLLQPSDWDSAENEAVTLGGFLVTVDDAAEQAWINSTFLPTGSQTRILWNGLTDVAQEGTFVWASGEPVTYSNWFTLSGEPNNNDFGDPENYVAMNAHHANGASGGLGAWNDELEAGSKFSTNGTPLPHYGLVEVPEPGTFVLAVLCLFGILPLRRAANRRSPS